VSGWSTWQELADYRRRGPSLGPRAVVLAFCLNDLVRYEWTYGSGWELVPSEEVRRLGSPDEPTRTAEGLRILSLRGRFLRHRGTGPLARANGALLYAWDDEAWGRFDREVFRLEGLAPPAASWLVAFVPGKAQVEALRGGGDPEEVLFPQRRLKRLCRERGVPFLDLSGALLDASGDGVDALFLDHLHLTPRGHEAVARRLWPEVARRAGLPG
jgi:hypothetical protein